MTATESIHSTTTTDVGVRRADGDDKELVGAVIAAAFFDDPTTAWLYPDPQRRRQLLQPIFSLYASAYLPHGETYATGDGTGIAMWLPPGAELLAPEEEQAFGQAMQDLAAEGADRLVQLEETFAEHHPTEPLWYLQFLTTVPAFQGRGIGSAFLRRMLERADRDSIPAYHEATTPRNRALYERHGYVTIGEFTLPDRGPTLWQMWREPRSVT
jgi:GNAT superfamily N-acetyltransferase